MRRGGIEPLSNHRKDESLELRDVEECALKFELLDSTFNYRDEAETPESIFNKD